MGWGCLANKFGGVLFVLAAAVLARLASITEIDGMQSLIICDSQISSPE